MPESQNPTLLDDLRSVICGEVKSDRLTRALYATDASLYEIIPDVVVTPKTVADIVAAVRVCGKHGVPITARGAGTGLTGGAVNRGVQLDCSRHLNKVLHIDATAQTVRVEPGVVLDELNAELAPLGLYFSPDVATSSRATIGGMIANNSCGAHSIITGRTVTHIHSIEVVLSDGSTCHWGGDAPAHDNPLAQRCEEVLATVAKDHADEIAARFPKVMRSNAGYGLDRLRPAGNGINPEAILCGSEGTLGIIAAATLNLLPLPKCKGMIAVHYDDLLASLASVPSILKHGPSAVELVDKFILDATKTNSAMARRRWFLEGDPQAILIVEFYADDEAVLSRRLDRLSADLKSQGIGYAWPIITEPTQQVDVWELRNAGLGLLMSTPGDVQSYAFVEDTAVDPARLHDYIKRFNEILAEEGVEQAGCYAHASVGCLHMRPMLNLKTKQGRDGLHRIGDRISSLAIEYGGTMTAEHGDGIVRSGWLQKLYGPKIIEAFQQIKGTFDPQGIFNPGKIVDALPIDANLRHSGDGASQGPDTILDFDAHGGMAGLAGMCSGIGQCRQRLAGTMCPSYMATGDEKHSTRARANALRIALSDADLLEGLVDVALEDVFDLCLSCKACKTECPTGTDIAKLKAEWLAARNEQLGVPRRSRLIARSIDLAAWGSRFAPLSNWLMQSKVARVFLEHWYGLDRRMPPPKFAGTTFRQWFAKRPKQVPKHLQPESEQSPEQTQTPKGQQVVYFVDTWVNYHLPQVGQAAVKVLEALGCEVIVPPTVCCGRPLISKGLLSEAKLLAEDNVAILSPYANRGIPIVGTEPSCVAVLMDELPQFVRSSDAKRIAEVAQTIETFIANALAKNPQALTFKPGRRPIVYHGHCHQKALIGTDDARDVLERCSGGAATEINSGCCGMAGSFGHEVEHYDTAKAVGEQRLFPAVRDRGDADVAVSGFSCRQHIAHHTDAVPRHVIELVADALA